MALGPNPRRIALRTLREIEQRRGFSNQLLSQQLERHVELDRRDRGLVTTLVYGVLRHRGRLDAAIDHAADRPAKLKGELRTILRVAAFEILELERPLGIASAEALKVARRIDPRGRLKALVTALLSKIAREVPALEATLEEGAPLERLVRRWSLPRWLAARWVEQLGVELALARAEALSGAPAIDLRVDLSRAPSLAAICERLLAEHPGLRVLELPAAFGEGEGASLRVRGGGDLFYGPLFEEGLISIQSLGSQRAVPVLAPQPGERVLDACAGMGTKTAQLAEHMDRRGHIVAVDRSAERLASLEEARARARMDVETLTLEVLCGDLRELSEDERLRGASFDAALLDAPCTGLGNLARHPELRWTSEAADVDACATLQASLLRRCAELLRPGGRLVYAVCSLEPEEGPAIIDAFLASRADFRCTRREAWTPESHRCDGFWSARLDRLS